MKDQEPNEEFADVRLACGRFYLNIAGLALAVEGDVCRESECSGAVWTKESLRDVAARINYAVARSR